jgi:flagellar hook assembly protein FlgD
MQTTVRIETPVNGYTTIKAYDISGREVDNIFEGSLNSGTHIFRWNPAFLPTGNYFIHVVSGSYAKTVKSVLLK